MLILFRIYFLYFVSVSYPGVSFSCRLHVSFWLWSFLVMPSVCISKLIFHPEWIFIRWWKKNSNMTQKRQIVLLKYVCKHVIALIVYTLIRVSNITSRIKKMSLEKAKVWSLVLYFVLNGKWKFNGNEEFDNEFICPTCFFLRSNQRCFVCFFNNQEVLIIFLFYIMLCISYTFLRNY